MKNPEILESLKYLEFQTTVIKKLGKPEVLSNLYMLRSKIFIWYKKYFIYKKTFKEPLKFVLNIVYYLTQFLALNLILNLKKALKHVTSIT